jgi:H+-transporting ATPase
VIRNKAEVEEAVEAATNLLGGRGIRSLAVARSPVGAAGGAEAPLEFAALITFLDPPRPDTKETIHRAYENGVDVKMITGDHLLIARETARMLGMGLEIKDPKELPAFEVGSAIPKDLHTKYGDLCYEADGFAQVRQAWIHCHLVFPPYCVLFITHPMLEQYL